MSDAYAQYTFLPWVRQGLSRYLDTLDQGQTDAAAQAALPVRLRLNQYEPIERMLDLLGPGDVVGLEAAQVIRREPERQSKSFAANMFPFVEFRSPDLPWLFTPLRPDTNNRLRPWLCLVVVRVQDGVTVSPGARGSPSRLTIAAPANAAMELPPLEDAWAWAHCQVTRRADDIRPLKQILAENPDLAVSRLMCPRRLEPLTSYHACIVPAFRAGVAAALGLPAVTDLSPAWTQQDTATLPVYDSWEFATGPAGDFEALAQLLKPAPAPDRLGRRDVDIANPQWGNPADFGIPAPAEGTDTRQVAAFEGALRAPAQDRLPLPELVRNAYPARLAEILTQAEPGAEDADDPDPIVAPPLYGRWHSGRDAATISGHWMGELNLDPRDRSAAGLGTAAVRMHQEALMHSAWTQVDGIMQANTLLRRGKVAEAVGTAFKARHLDPMTSTELLSLTFPVHAKLRMSPITLREKIERSQLPVRAVSPALRRVLRQGGPLSRGAGGVDGHAVLPELLGGRLTAAAEHRGFSGTATAQALADKSLGAPWQKFLHDLLSGRTETLAAAALVLLILVFLVPPALAIAAQVLAATAGALAAYAYGNRVRWARYRSLRRGGADPATLAAARPPADFVVSLDRPASTQNGPTPPDIAATRITQFRQAAIARRKAVLAQMPEPSPAPEPLSVPDMHRTLLLRLNPSLLARARFADRVTRPDSVLPVDPLDDVMVYPVFDTPMYQTLRDQNQDYVLPGLQNLPANTVTVVEANRRFIEAFMVGANHEMARELRWREFPTDQRGSYFRQFWDPRGTLPPGNPAATEARRDIREIPRWSDDQPLGLAGLPAGAEPEKLVLLVRGELLRRFPTAQIYAQKARFEASGDRVPDDVIRQPIFRGTLPPDIQFMGFDFDHAEAFGSTDPADSRPGWFFVIQQQPTEPRFGLDVATGFAPDLEPLTSWDDLTWGHFADDSLQLKALTHLSPAIAPTTSGALGPGGIAWGRDASASAYTTLQKPVRIAIHADDMLPPVPDDD